ncbi:MAG: hypothetical protein ACMG6S_18985, partial [Byssovorax sp.]
AFMGDMENAMDSLKRAAGSGLIDFGWLEHCPLLGELRRDPSFPAVRAQVKQRADEILDAYRTG